MVYAYWDTGIGLELIGMFDDKESALKYADGLWDKHKILIQLTEEQV